MATLTPGLARQAYEPDLIIIHSHFPIVGVPPGRMGVRYEHIRDPRELKPRPQPPNFSVRMWKSANSECLPTKHARLVLGLVLDKYPT